MARVAVVIVVWDCGECSAGVWPCLWFEQRLAPGVKPIADFSSECCVCGCSCFVLPSSPQRNAVFKVVVKTGRGDPVGDVLPIRRLPTVVLDGGGCALGCFQRVGPCVVSLQLLKYLCECFRCLLL